MGVATSIVIGAVAIAGAAYSGYSAYKQGKAQKKAAKKERKVNNEAARRQRVQELRRVRAARASILNVGAQSGASGSSAVAGGMASVDAQGGSNIGFSNFTGAAQNYISKKMQTANNWATRGQIAGGISDLAFNAFGATGGWDDAKKIFGG